MTRVPLIMPDRVRLRNLTRSLKENLIANGFAIVPDGNGDSSVLFDEHPESVLENKSLQSVLIFLAKNGVAFETDMKQIYSPAYAIKLLRDNMLYSGPAWKCGFDGKEWTCSEI